MNRKFKHLKICTFNANGIVKQKDEITAFLAQQGIDVLLLQETFLKQNKNFAIPNYAVHRTDRNERGGGTAVLIKRHIKHTRIIEPETKNLEYTAIHVHSINTTIVSCYKKPTAEINEEDLTKLINLGPRVLIGGDLNSKHKSWNSVTENKAGKTLKRITTKIPNIRITAPKEMTHERGQSKDVLDFYVHKTNSHVQNCRTVHALNSDHYPVLCTLNGLTQIPLPVVKNTHDWKNFKNVLEKSMEEKDKPSSEHELSQQLREWTSKVVEAMTKSEIPAKHQEIELRLPQALMQKIKRKNKLRKEYQDTRYPPYKTEVNRLQQEIKEELAAETAKRWSKFISKTYEAKNPERIYKIPSILKKTRRPIPELKTENGKATTDREKADAIAEKLKEQFTPNSIPMKELEGKIEWNYALLDRITTANQAEVSTDEVQEIVKNMPLKKAPGLDGISNQALKALPAIAIQNLAKIVNGTLNLAHYPNELKVAKIIPIQKVGKSTTDPRNYRPISLLNGTAKIIEKVLHKRITEHFEERNLFNRNQHGFRKSHSTTTQLKRLIKTIKDAKQQRKTTVFVSLDLEKAFDSINHKALIHKL